MIDHVVRLNKCDWCDRLRKWKVESDTGVVQYQMCCVSSDIVACKYCCTHSGTERPYTFHCQSVTQGEVVARTCPHCLLDERTRYVIEEFERIARILKISEYRELEVYQECLSNLFECVRKFDWNRDEKFDSYLWTALERKTMKVLEAISLRCDPPKIGETKEERKARIKRAQTEATPQHRTRQVVDLHDIPDREEINTPEQIEAEERALREHLKNLEKCLSALPCGVADVYRMSNGLVTGHKPYKHRDIAKELGIHKNTVTRRYKQAEEHVAKWLSEESGA